MARRMGGEGGGGPVCRAEGKDSEAGCVPPYSPGADSLSRDSAIAGVDRGDLRLTKAAGMEPL